MPMGETERPASGIASYYWLVVRTAFRHSLSRTQDILFALFLIVGCAAWLAKLLFPKFAAMIPDVSGWQIAAVTFGAIVTLRLFLAPYWIYKEQAAQLRQANPDEARLDRPPQIEIHFEKRAPYEIANVEHHHVKSSVCIGIRNSGGGSISNCRVYVENIVPEPAIPGGLPILLNLEPFLLRHDDPERLIEIACHWDHVDQFRFSAPIGGGFADALSFMPSQPQRTIVIKVEASECQRSATFRITVDNRKTIHLDFISYVN